jgi:hypothetical protein
MVRQCDPTIELVFLMRRKSCHSAIVRVALTEWALRHLNPERDNDRFVNLLYAAVHALSVSVGRWVTPAPAIAASKEAIEAPNFDGLSGKRREEKRATASRGACG